MDFWRSSWRPTSVSLDLVEASGFRRLPRQILFQLVLVSCSWSSSVSLASLSTSECGQCIAADTWLCLIAFYLLWHLDICLFSRLKRFWEVSFNTRCRMSLPIFYRLYPDPRIPTFRSQSENKRLGQFSLCAERNILVFHFLFNSFMAVLPIPILRFVSFWYAFSVHIIAPRKLNLCTTLISLPCNSNSSVTSVAIITGLLIF